jgi:hypothetical protein
MKKDYTPMPYTIRDKDGRHVTIADKAEAKLLLAKDVNKTRNVVNVGVERDFGDNSRDETKFLTSLSSRYQMVPSFEPGIEVYNNWGSVSESSDFDDEDHRAGPVAYGKLGPVKYQLGYLFGLSDSAPDGTTKAVLEYGLHF